mgnify:CR=1 FL=1
MRKKNSKNKKKHTTQSIKSLPQNIFHMGEVGREGIKVYIQQAVYKEIQKFTLNKTTNESGGVLLGDVLYELGKTNIIVSGFIEAKNCDATPTSLTFTHDTWNYIHKENNKNFNDKKIVGWIHTHPDFGIFLSDYDKFIHNSFFKEPWQIAYVIDPVRNEEGFYYWDNDSIEKCSGFYIYDKNRVKINIKKADVNSKDKTNKNAWSIEFIAIIIFLIIVIVAQFFNNFRLEKQISELKEKITILNKNINILNTRSIDIEQYARYLENKINDNLNADDNKKPKDNGE